MADLSMQMVLYLRLVIHQCITMSRVHHGVKMARFLADFKLDSG